jgi:hypothetical protein
MPAITADPDEPDEQTREYAEADPGGDTMIVAPGQLEGSASNNSLQATDGPVGNQRRVLLVLIVLAVLAIVAALVIWWLVR